VEEMEETDAEEDSTEKQADRASHPMEKMESEQPGDGIMITTIIIINSLIYYVIYI
jgi:hypothetical protein